MQFPARPVRRWFVLVFCGLLTVVMLPPAAAAPFLPQTYVGASYTDQLRRPPTATENQSKIWFYADAWWALMVDDTGRTARVHELMRDHTWRPTSTVISEDVADVGDALLAGNTTHVLVRETDGELRYVKLRFDAASREYAASPSRRVTRRGSDAVPTIAEDTAGRMWVAFATVNKIFYTYSDDGGRNWSDLALLAETGTGSTPEAAAMVSYDDQVGVFWSDQGNESFEFAHHKDGDPPTVWTREQVVAGPGRADNHVSLRRVDTEPGDTLVAVVKTSVNDLQDQDGPLIQALVRRYDGQWHESTVATVADGLNDPVVVVNDATRTLYVLASGAGDIVMKTASLDDLVFESGRGELFMLGVDGPLVDPTVPKQAVGAESGVVALASDDTTHVYHHAEMPLGEPEAVADPNDTTPPGPPEVLHGRALSETRVVLSWDAASDGDRWSPARDGVPVAEYIVRRDGAEVARVQSTSLEDHLDLPPNGGPPPEEVEYQVYAVDLAGNRSQPADVVIALPVDDGTWNAYVIGVPTVGVLLAGLGLLVWHRRRTRMLDDLEGSDHRVAEPVPLALDDRG